MFHQRKKVNKFKKEPFKMYVRRSCFFLRHPGLSHYPLTQAGQSPNHGTCKINRSCNVYKWSGHLLTGLNVHVDLKKHLVHNV